MKHVGTPGTLAGMEQKEAGMELREKWKCAGGKAMQHNANGCGSMSLSGN